MEALFRDLTSGLSSEAADMLALPTLYARDDDSDDWKQREPLKFPG